MRQKAKATAETQTHLYEFTRKLTREEQLKLVSKGLVLKGFDPFLFAAYKTFVLSMNDDVPFEEVYPKISDILSPLGVDQGKTVFLWLCMLHVTYLESSEVVNQLVNAYKDLFGHMPPFFEPAGFNRYEIKSLSKAETILDDADANEVREKNFEDDLC